MVTIRSRDGKHITGVDEWFAYAPPAGGAKHWKDGRSAKELAKAWFRTGEARMPDELVALLESHPVIREFRADEGGVEQETVLDEFKGKGRYHDLIVIGRADAERVLLAVEAKNDEPFGDLIGAYLESSVRTNPRSRVPDRIRELAMGVFGCADVEDLRYQLLHAAAGTLIEAKKRGASTAVLVIYEFVPAGGKTDKAAQNERDLAAFIARLSGGMPAAFAPGRLFGPFHVPGNDRIPADIPLYIGKVEMIVGG